MSTGYRNSVVGFIDILGVSSALADPGKAKRYSEAVAAILRPMIGDKGEFCFMLPHVHEARQVEIILSPSFSKVSFISDSIVVSAPLDEINGEEEKYRAILFCLEAVKAMQRSLLLLGLRSRGGVSKGGLIHDGELLVGEGLIRAYDIERHQANVPRAIIDKELINDLLSAVKEYFPIYRNRVAHCIRQDEDGFFFVDYLAFCPTNGFCGLESEFLGILEQIKADLQSQKDQPWAPKLEWLARYVQASTADCKSGRVEPCEHASLDFALSFPRTNETLREYMASEGELARRLGLETISASGLARGFPLWPLGWRSVMTDQQKEKLETELALELSAGHVLDSKSLSILGRFEHRDDVLFLLDDSRVAQVHLTWHKEDRPEWPRTTIYPSFQTWAHAWRLGEANTRRSRS